MSSPFMLRPVARAAPPGFPPDVAPNQIIYASHINAIRDSVAVWPGNVSGNSKILSNVGQIGIGRAPAAPLDVGAVAASTAHAIFHQVLTDSNFQLRIETGPAVPDDLFRFGLSYAGAWNAGLRFFRGGGAGDGFLAIDAGGAERMRIAASGVVSIGNASPNPTVALEVFKAGATQVQALIGQSVAAVGILTSSNVPAIQGYNGTGATGAINLALQPAGGNVGIGTMNPLASLHLTRSDSLYQLKLESVGVRTYGIAVSGTGSLTIDDVTAGVSRLTIAADGNVGVGMSSPINPFHVRSGGVDLLMAIKHPGLGQGVVLNVSYINPATAEVPVSSCWFSQIDETNHRISLNVKYTNGTHHAVTFQLSA